MKRFVIERNIPAIGSLDRDQYGATAQRSNEALSRPDDEIRLYDFASGRLVALLKGHTHVVCGLAFSPDDRHLIVSGAARPFGFP